MADEESKAAFEAMLESLPEVARGFVQQYFLSEEKYKEIERLSQLDRGPRSASYTQMLGNHMLVVDIITIAAQRDGYRQAAVDLLLKLDAYADALHESDKRNWRAEE